MSQTRSSQPVVAGASQSQGGGTKIAVPTSASELRALRERRNELQNQLENVTERRGQLLPQAIIARDGQLRQEIEGRIRTLDERASRLEGELLAAEEAISTALARGVESEGLLVTPPAPPVPRIVQIPWRQPWWQGGHVPAEALLFEALAFVLVGAVLMRWIWKRAQRKAAALPAPADQTDRLNQLQQSVDVIALEVERIAENQRFVSKLLNDWVPAIAESSETPGKRG